MNNLLTILDNFIMKVQPEWKAIHEVADQYRPYLQRSYLRAFKKLRESVDVEKFLEIGIDAIDWSVFEKACEKNYDIIGCVLMGAGTQAAFYLSTRNQRSKTHPVRKDNPNATDNSPSQPLIIASVLGIPEANVGTATGAFNMRNPKAIEWAAHKVAENIREVDEETRKAVRLIIEEAFKYGGHPYDTARTIKDFIGLTEKQMQALLKYKKLIEQESGVNVDRLVEIKRLSMIKRRAETIARTETIDAANQGQLLHWEDMTQKGYLDDTFKKKWSTTPDDRKCALCSAIDGEIVDIDKPFSWGGMRPTRHPKCRCAMSLVEVEEE